MDEIAEVLKRSVELGLMTREEAEKRLIVLVLGPKDENESNNQGVEIKETRKPRKARIEWRQHAAVILDESKSIEERARELGVDTRKLSQWKYQLNRAAK